MNRLSRELRVQVLQMLCEGNSIRGIERTTGCSKHTVTKLLVDAGWACGKYQDKALRDLTCKRGAVDEIWSFAHTKRKNMQAAKASPDKAGDTCTWTAICADTKLVMSWLVGGHDGESAMAVIDDLSRRLSHRIQLTSDGYKIYLAAVGGDPDPKSVSTSSAEHNNLTTRMHMRHLTRLTNPLNKKIFVHTHAVALHFMHYNFVKQHKCLGGVTPALVAGVTDKLWSMKDIVAVLEAAESARIKRGPSKKRPKK